MVHLDRNENAYGPAPGCYEQLRRAGIEELSTYTRCYTRGYKSDLTRRLSNDLGIPEERVILGYGSEDLLKQIVHCYVPLGGTVLVPAQSWWYYKSLAAEVGGTCTTFALREKDGTFEYDTDVILDLYDRLRPEVILIASPNNPTGNSISPESLEKIVGHCTASIVVVDQAYLGFSAKNEIDARSIVNSHPRTVLVRTFSKLHALAGLRIGYALVGAELQSLIRFSARYLGYNRISEAAALAALDDPGYYQNVAEKIGRGRLQISRAARISGLMPFASEANFILIRICPDLRQAFQRAFREHEISVKYLDDPGLDDCVRITIGTEDQNRLVGDALESVRHLHVISSTARSTT